MEEITPPELSPGVILEPFALASRLSRSQRSVSPLAGGELSQVRRVLTSNSLKSGLPGVHAVLGVYGKGAAEVPIPQNSQSIEPLDAALTELCEFRLVRWRLTGRIRLQSILDTNDAQVITEHRQAHGDIFSLQGHVTKIGVSSHMCRIESLDQMHEAGAVRADSQAAVSMVTALDSMFLTVESNLFKIAARPVQHFQ